MFFVHHRWFPAITFAAAFIFWLILVASYGQRGDVPTQPKWTPSGDSLITMDHHNVLICAVRAKEALPPDLPTQILTQFMGRMGGGQQLKLYPSQRGLCGVLSLTQFGTVPVQVMLNPNGKSADYLRFTATYWEPTNQPEPAQPYAWSTVALTEREERWWIQFTFRSLNEPVTSVTVGVE